MSTTLDRLATLVARQHRLPPDRLTPDATLESLGLDSLATVELLWTVEETFGVSLPGDPTGLRTLGDVARCIDERLAAVPPGAAVGGAATGAVTPGRP